MAKQRPNKKQYKLDSFIINNSNFKVTEKENETEITNKLFKII